MKLFELSGLVTPLEKRQFRRLDTDEELNLNDLAQLKLTRIEMDNIRYMRPGEQRTVKGITIKRIDAE